MEQDINELIEELTKVRPDELSREGLKLFNKINEIIDKNKELEEENTELKTMDCVNIFELGKKSARDRIEYDYIPKSKVKEKIEELNKLLEEDLQDERKVNSNRFIIICQCKSCLQKLLEKRK